MGLLRINRPLEQMGVCNSLIDVAREACPLVCVCVCIRDIFGDTARVCREAAAPVNFYCKSDIIRMSSRHVPLHLPQNSDVPIKASGLQYVYIYIDIDVGKKLIQVAVDTEPVALLLVAIARDNSRSYHTYVDSSDIAAAEEPGHDGRAGKTVPASD